MDGIFTQIFTWGQLGTITSILLGILGLGFGLWKQRSADLHALHKKIEGVKDSLTAALNDFKVEVAREYPTAKALQASEERLTGAIDRLAERIDRWLERHP